MSFNFDLGNVTKQMNNGNGDLGCLGCSDFGPDTVPDPGLPALKPNVAIIIIGLGFTLILVAAFALFAKFMRPHLSRQDAGSRMWEDVVKDGHLLDTNIIRNLPLVVFSSESFNGMNLDSECAVCLSVFEDKEELRLLPNCKHMFHPSCIDNWLRSHPSCPLCRSTIISSSWTLRNPSAGETLEAGAVALSIFVSSQGGAGLNNSVASSQQHSTNGEISGSSRRDEDPSHRIEITVVQDQQQHYPQAESPPCTRTASWCSGSFKAARNSKEQRKETPESPTGGVLLSSVFQQTQRVADVHEFDPHQNAGPSQSSQSVFIFIPQVPAVPEPSTGASFGVAAAEDSGDLKPVFPDCRSAISRLQEEVRSTLKASGSLRKFGNNSSRGVSETSPVQEITSLRSGGEAVTAHQRQGGDGCSPASKDQSTEARHGVCTGEREVHQ